ncbi:MAG TPA: hypothetical protein VHQ20_00285, partial [Patescibacteria group bacterium]|nr:hypothetical protein [Patescibacteria group bacterium]
MKKQTSFLIIIALLFTGLFNSAFVYAQQSVQSGFNPNQLIDDRIFSNVSTMTVADIQKFLSDQGSVLANTSSSFVLQFREPVGNSALKTTLEDPKIDNTTPRTAAQLIYDAANSSGLNPQVILVTLNKEQSLITGRQTSTPDQLQRALDFALGFGCPDSAPCGDTYKGFYFQLFGGVDTENNRYLGAAKSLMKSFSTPGGRGPFFNGSTSKVGDIISLNNTLGDYDGVLPNQNVVLSNAATAALYRYTPHVFNGNYNFWKFFSQWFGRPNSDVGSGTGTTSNSNSNSNTSTTTVISGLVRTGSSELYMIENGSSFKVLPFVARARDLSTSGAKRITDSALAKYPSGGVLAVPDNTLIKVSTQYYIFQANQKHPITEQAIKDMGLTPSGATSVNTDEAALFTTGPDLTMPEGSILKTDSNPAVYLLTGGKLKLFTYATFVQYNAAANLKIVTEDVISKYPQDGLVLPKPGSLVKAFGSQTVYFYEDGQKKPMDGEIFRNRGFSFTNVYELTQAVIDQLPLGPFPLPAD